MDIRDTEEFKTQQKIRLDKIAKEEISARSIIHLMKKSEELREKIYGEASLGKRGGMIGLGLLGFIFCLCTETSKFKTRFPLADRFLSKTIMTKALIVLVSARVGLFLETGYHEYHNEDYTEYRSLLDYTESVKQKRLYEITYLNRLHLLTGYNFEKYYTDIRNKIS